MDTVVLGCTSTRRRRPDGRWGRGNRSVVGHDDANDTWIGYCQLGVQRVDAETVERVALAFK